jgi:hypothetical protein
MFEITWFDVDVYKLLFRLTINVIFVTIIARGIYYPKNHKKDYLFTYYTISFLIFFLCFSLKKLDIDTGMGLGLFAIFGIIRYRTNAIEIKDMTYLFTVIGIGVINSLAANRISIAELLLINFFITGLIYLFEYKWLPEYQTDETTVVVSLKEVDSLETNTLKTQLKTNTGLDIKHIKIGKINYNNQSAQVIISYKK